MDQSLVHTFSWRNSYGPMVLKVLQKLPPTLVLVHGWLFPGVFGWGRRSETQHDKKDKAAGLVPNRVGGRSSRMVWHLRLDPPGANEEACGQ